MWLISRRKQQPVPDSPPSDDLDGDLTGWFRYRRMAIRLLIVVFLLIPAISAVHRHQVFGRPGVMVLVTFAFVVLVDRIVLTASPEAGPRPRWQWYVLVAAMVLGGGLFAVGKMSWLTAMAISSAGLGRVVAGTRAFGLGLACCVTFALGVGIVDHLGSGNTLVAVAVVALAGLLAHSAERRWALMYHLRQTRAELARAAVAEERLRISRDLHDLLGHSLSLIALKAELAGRMIDKDPDRAAREIADLETVARRSLTEVRQAVTGYRQPSLAAELVSSRRMLASAGVQVRVRVPNAYSLPPAVDALLGWTVREGVTNIVRHAAAKHAEIGIEVTDTEAAVWLSDDGTGPHTGGLVGGPVGSSVGVRSGRGPAASVVPDEAEEGVAEKLADLVPETELGAGAELGAEAGLGLGLGIGAGPGAGVAPTTGSGLAGLAERAARLGGTLSAGAGKRGGFWLRVSVPLTVPGQEPGDTANGTPDTAATRPGTAATGTPGGAGVGAPGGIGQEMAAP